MGKRLRVGNLGNSIDAVKLGEIFSECGCVTNIRIAESQYSGQSRGFGFIEMANEVEAEDCIKRLHGKEHAGRILTVVEAPPDAKDRARRRSK